MNDIFTWPSSQAKHCKQSEVANIDGSLTSLRERASWQRLEDVRRCFFGCEEGECSVTIFCLNTGAVLEPDGDLLVKVFHRRMKGETVDATDCHTIIWELIVSAEAGLDVHSRWTTATEGTSWNVDFESMSLPVVS